MAREIINVGAAPNDGTGDPLRTAYIKTNNNFGELYSRAQTTPPSSLFGSLGDEAGMYAYDTNYFYYCYQDFDGTSQIWNQVSQIGNVSVTQIASGTSSVAFSDIDGNVLFTVDGTSDVVTVTNSAVNVVGDINATTNVTSGNLISLGLISAAGTITGNFFVGNGAFLTGINVSTTYSNANVTSFLPTYSGSLPNLSGNVTTDGNLTGAMVYGNGSQLTGMYGNANVATYLSTSAGNIIPAANVTSSLGNATHQWKDLWVSNSTIYINSVPVTVSGTTLQVNGQAVLSNGTSSAISTTGNVSAANLVTTGSVSAAGNVNAGNLNVSAAISSSGNVQSGNLRTTGSVSASGNVVGGNLTTVGTVSATAITANGNVVGGNLTTVGTVSATAITASGNISGNYILGNGAFLTGTGINLYGNAEVANYLPTYSGVISADSVVVVNDVSADTITATLSVSTGTVVATGNITGTNISADGNVDIVGNISGGNIVSTALVSADTVSAIGNISGSYFIGNGSQLTGITGTVPGNISSANVTYVAPYTNSVSRTGQSKYSDMVNVKDFGAVGDGVTDDRAAIQAAIDTTLRVYIPTGTYRLGSALGFYYSGQMISGDGRNKSVFLVDNLNYSFNMNDTAVLVFTVNEPGPTLRDLGIKFVQPVTSNRETLFPYPPAIYAQSVPRFTIQNCRITQGMTGIDMRGNSGGATIDGMEMSCYNFGIRIDGSLDTVRILRLQYWPFEIAGTPNESIFFDSTNRGVVSGRCDDLKINSCLFINGGIQLEIITTASGTTFGAVTDTDFDNFASFSMNGGFMIVSACYFTVGEPSYSPITFTDGFLRVDSCEFQAGVVVNNAFISQTGVNSYMQLVNTLFRNSGPGGGFYSMTAGTAIINGNQFVVGFDQNWSNPLVGILGGRCTFVNNRSNDKGTGTGNLIAVSNDNWHMIANNLGVGWGFSYPASFSTMVIANNR